MQTSKRPSLLEKWQSKIARTILMQTASDIQLKLNMFPKDSPEYMDGIFAIAENVITVSNKLEGMKKDSFVKVLKNVLTIYISINNYKYKINKLHSRTKITILIDLLIPRNKATEISDNIEYLYESRWVPRYGTKWAKIILYKEILFTILYVWGLQSLKFIGIIKLIDLVQKIILRQ